MVRFWIRAGQFGLIALASVAVFYVLGLSYVLIAALIALMATVLLVNRSWPGAWLDRILIVVLGVFIGVFWPALPIIAAWGDERKKAAEHVDCKSLVCRQTPCVCGRKDGRA